MKNVILSIALAVLGIPAQSQNWNVLLTNQAIHCIRPLNDKELIASCSNGQILKSYDGGNSWYGKQPISTKYLYSVSVVNEDIVYVSVENGVTKSNDGGETWTYIQPSTVNATLRAIHFMDENTGIGVGASSGGSAIFKTINGGKSWVQKLYNSAYTYFTSVQFVTPLIGFAVTDIPDLTTRCAIYKTTDGGENWTKVYNSSTEGLSDVFFIDEKNGFAVGGSRPTQVGAYFKSSVKRTTDGGSNWSNLISGNGNIVRSIRFLDASTGYAVTTNDFGYIDIMKTQNGGLQWSKLKWDYSEKYTGTGGLRTVVCMDANQIIAGGDDGMIVKSTDAGASWKLISKGQFASGQAGDITSTFFADEATAYACFPTSIHKSTNGGINWKVLTNSGFSALSFASANTGYAVGTNGRISKTTDGGTSWTAQTSTVTKYLVSAEFISQDVGYVGGESGTLLKTINGGSTWSKQTTGTLQDIIAIRFANATTGYALSKSPGSYNGSVLKTTDGGANWKQVRNTGGLGMQVYNADTIYLAGTSGGIIYSYDGGVNWASKATGVSKNLNAVLFSSREFGVAVGDEGTMVTTKDGGTTWTKETALTTNTLKHISLSRNGNMLVSGASGTLLVLPKSPTGVSALTNPYAGTPTFSISPTRTSSEIHLKITEETTLANLQFFMVDRSGRCVKTISPTSSEFSIPVQDLASGMYLLYDNRSTNAVKFIKE